MVRTKPSEVVYQKTSQAASHVSVRRGFRRHLSAAMKTRRSHVVAWLLSDKEHQNSRSRQNHIDRRLPHQAQSEIFLSDQHSPAMRFAEVSLPGVTTNSSPVLFSPTNSSLRGPMPSDRLREPSGRGRSFASAYEAKTSCCHGVSLKE